MLGPTNETAIFNDISSYAEPPEWIPYLPKAGKYKHPRYGDIKLTKERAAAFVDNFKNAIYQDRLPIDAEHQTKLSGALGWITDMRLNDDGSADAKVDWTKRGVSLIEGEQFKYFSPEWFESWNDPATGNLHKDVAIGGALTTRPFFKHGSLRPLVASEGRLFGTPDEFTPPADEDEPISIRFTAFAFAEDAEGDGKDDDPMGERIELTEEQYAEFMSLSERVEAEAAARKAAEERVTALEHAERSKRFSDMVTGKDGGHHWFGEPEKHVSFMESLADQFGEDSEQFTFYVEKEKAHAEQLATSALFNEKGTNKPVQANKGWDAIEAEARAMAEADPNLTLDMAREKVMERRPELFVEAS
jgi:hypothetical protein